MDFGFVFFFNSILLGIGLAMDAFSVSLANGLNEPAMRRRKMWRIRILPGVDAHDRLALRPHHCGALPRL